MKGSGIGKIGGSIERKDGTIEKTGTEEGEGTDRGKRKQIYLQLFASLVSQEGTRSPLCSIFFANLSLTEGLTPPQRSFL